MEPQRAPAQPRPALTGSRVDRRADPRLSVALAAAGCALAIFGVVVLGADGLAGGDDGGGGSQLPGILLSGAVVAAGIALLQTGRTGALATAGAVACAGGIPLLLFFLTFDDGSFPPYSTEAILLLSTGAWAGLYLVGPGRTRPVFLGAACVGLWLSVLQLVEEIFTFPFQVLEAATFGFDDGGEAAFGGPDLPDPATLGILSLAFGAGYLALARRWDRSGKAGAATPVTVAALVALPAGVQLLGAEIEATGSGLLGAAVGAVVAAHGASVGRRATTWLGAAAVAAGLLVVVLDNIDDATPGGIALIALGAGVVAGAEALRRATDEPDETAVSTEPVAF